MWNRSVRKHMKISILGVSKPCNCLLILHCEALGSNVKEDPTLLFGLHLVDFCCCHLCGTHLAKNSLPLGWTTTCKHCPLPHFQEEGLLATTPTSLTIFPLIPILLLKSSVAKEEFVGFQFS